MVPMEVMEEIRSLRRIVEQHLAGFAWGETARSEPVKTEILRQMLDAGFSPQFARDLLTDLPQEMNNIEAMAWVKGAADRSLMTIGNENDIVDRGGVYALVGPTGVGKTTTTAKLAARCVLRHGPSKVALVTTDGYRIGAHEQLRIYGRILGVSVHLVKDATELRQTLIELQNKHMVLIDTMGMSQKDKLVPELTDMLAGCDVQRLLLLNSTARGDTLDDVVRAYAGDTLAGCILTKIDEAASLATALDVIMRHSLKLLYVSNGQRVPEDLHLPNRSYLLHRAFKDVPESFSAQIRWCRACADDGQCRHGCGRRTSWLIFVSIRPLACGACSAVASSCRWLLLSLDARASGAAWPSPILAWRWLAWARKC